MKIELALNEKYLSNFQGKLNLADGNKTFFITNKRIISFRKLQFWSYEREDWELSLLNRLEPKTFFIEFYGNTEEETLTIYLSDFDKGQVLEVVKAILDRG